MEKYFAIKKNLDGKVIKQPCSREICECIMKL